MLYKKTKSGPNEATRILELSTWQCDWPSRLATLTKPARTTFNQSIGCLKVTPGHTRSRSWLKYIRVLIVG